MAPVILSAATARRSASCATVAARRGVSSFNYNIANNANTYGPVVDMTAGGQIGSASTSSTTSVNPFINWSY